MAAAAHAGLAGADEGAEGRVVHRPLDIEIVEHHDGRLAAEFHGLVGEDACAAAEPAIRPASVPPVSTSLLMSGCSASALPVGGAEPQHDVEHALRQAGLGEDLRELQRGQRACTRRA